MAETRTELDIIRAEMAGESEFIRRMESMLARVETGLQARLDGDEKRFQERLDSEGERFREQLEKIVRERVETITAPLTNEMLTDTVKLIAKGMIDQYVIYDRRVRELAAEGVRPLQDELDMLTRRVAALEVASVQKETDERR